MIMNCYEYTTFCHLFSAVQRCIFALLFNRHIPAEDPLQIVFSVRSSIFAVTVMITRTPFRTIAFVLLVAVSSLVAVNAIAQTSQIFHARGIFLDDGAGHSVTLLPPTTGSGHSITLPPAGLIWPNANAAGVLTNDGSGNLSWVTGGGGLTLPYSGSVSSASPAFSIANTGSGLAINAGGSIQLPQTGALFFSGTQIFSVSNPVSNGAIAIGVGVPNTGTANTAIGFDAMQTNGSANDVGNTAVGVTSLASLGNGGGSDYNTAIGREAGFNVENGQTSGGRNTFLGADADVAPAGPSGITGATAVGFQAIVGASNTMQLGSPNLTLVNTSGDYATGGHYLSKNTTFTPASTGLITSASGAGSDVSGQLSYTTTGPGACSMTMTFAAQYATAPYVVVSASNSPASTNTNVYASCTATTMTINFTTSGAQSGSYSYIVMH